MSRHPRSPIGAFLLAAPTALALWGVGYFVYGAVTDGFGTVVRVVPYLVLGAVLFGLPVVAAALGGLAAPAYVVLRRMGRLTLPATLVTGGVVAVLTRLAVVALWGDPEARFVPVPVVLFVGVVTAAVWWRTWTAPERGLRGRGTL